MGEVYRATDTTLKRAVAIKVLPPSVAGDAQTLARFEREAEVLASLNHPNIAAIYGVQPWEGSIALVMELVEGDNLRDWFRRSRPMEGVLEIARQVLAALGAAHRTGVIHRDLKPENVMVRPDGYVKVLDFGLAKRLPSSLQAGAPTTKLNVSEPGQRLGTVNYMSPEQIQGLDADARSDLFAFGIVLYEMLTGRHPWPRDSAVDTLHAIMHDEPPWIESRPVEAGMVAVVQRLLCKRAAERYGSAEAVIDALAVAAASHRPPAASRPNPDVLTSIAVLPFVLLNDSGDRRALSLGFADALITIISNLEDVVVAPTSAILNYAAGVDPAQVARDLRVRYTLQGTVQKGEGHWRVSTQLFDAVMQRMAASETHDFTLDNVFDVQDGIGRHVVDLLHRRFPRAALSRDRYSSDPEAYNAFMAGLRESFSDQPDTLAIAAEHLSRAVERDPEFALAHATLSFVAMNIHFEFDPQRRWLQRAEDHCRLALSLDNQLPEGHLARAWILWSPAKNFQHAEALAALEQVLASRPTLERAHNRMSSIYLHIGRLEDRRAAHERALRSNPRTRTGNLEYFYIYSGDFVRADEAAEAWYRERPANVTALLTWAITALLSGRLELAEERLASASRQSPGEPLVVALEGILHARRGHSDRALECVGRAVGSPRSFGHTHHVHHHAACVYALLGDLDRAMAWLERAADGGFPCWPFFRIDPFLENLRDQPAFIQLMADLEEKYPARESSA
jgi:eukaryotic-like serine/threonine-protein kinase